MRPWHHSWLLLAAALGAAGMTRAQTPDLAAPLDSQDIVEVSGTEGTSGRAAVNAAAGNMNQQANVGVIAIGDSAIAIASVIQITDVLGSPGSAYKSALITDGAFAGSNGMIAVNVAAGSGNQQANLAVLAIGIEGRVVTDAMLSQTRASTSPSGVSAQSASPEIAAGVSPDAFAGASGLVQVSLIGGERNSSANIFVLTSSGSADP